MNDLMKGHMGLVSVEGAHCSWRYPNTFGIFLL